MAFDYDLDFDKINFRKQPELYRVGRGEQGVVLLVELYKSEILSHWRFKTTEIATESSEKIYQMYLKYKEDQDFIGMDMARKFLQMGYTRSRRYANYKDGRKYEENGEIKERTSDEEKAESAAIFEKKWKIVREDEDYLKLKKEHQKKIWLISVITQEDDALRMTTIQGIKSCNIPASCSMLKLKLKLYTQEGIQAFKERYEAEELQPFSCFLEQ